MNPIRDLIPRYNPITPLINTYQLESIHSFIKNDKEDDFLDYINKWEIDPLQIQLKNMDLIHFCAARGWCRIIDLLIERGEDINKPCGQNYATELTQKKIVDYTLPENYHSSGDTPIHLAVKFRQNGICKLLLEHNASLQTGNVYDMTPLMIAILINDHSAIDMILAATENDSLHCIDENGNNALHYAANNGNEHIIRQLLNMEVSPNCVNKLNQTPLVIAASTISEPLLMELVNATDENLLNTVSSIGQITLNIATKRKLKGACHLLIKKNADPGLTSKDQETALMLAICNGLEDLAMDYLDVISIDSINKSESNSGGTALYLAVALKNMSICHKLLEKGANPNLSCKNGFTPLVIAMATENFSLAKILLEKSDLTLVDKRGWNPSHFAQTLLQHVNGEARDELRALSFDEHKDLNNFIVMQRFLTLKFHAAFNIELNDRKIRIENGIASINFDAIKDTLHNYLIEKEHHKNPVFLPIFTEDVIWPQEISSKKILSKIEKGKIAILSTGWRGDIGKVGHAVSVVISETHLYLCNRGRGKESGITIYEILNLKQLKPDLKKMYERGGESKRYLTYEINSSTNLKKIHHISQKSQRMGNCTWTSSKSAAFALLLELHLKSGAEFNTAIEASKQIYKDWSMYDRDITLYTYIRNYLTGPYHKIDNKKSDQGVVPIHRLLTEILISTGRKNRSKWAKLMRQYLKEFQGLKSIDIPEVSWAIIEQDFLKAEELIEEATLENTTGYSALHFAALSGNELIVNKLLNKGLKLTGKHNEIPTPAHLAMREGLMPLAKFLISKTPDLNLADQNGQTILHLACETNATDIALDLLGKNKVDKCRKDDDGQTPLMLAIIKGFDRLAGLLITHQNVIQLNLADNCGKTAFHHAINNMSERICKLLIKKNIPLNQPDEDGNTPLISALLNGKTKLAESIIKKLKDEDLDHADKDGCTAFHYASDGNHLEICKLLLNRGASPTSLTKNKNSPLKFAVSKGHTELAEWLIGELKDEDLDHADKDGWTAFHSASDGNHLEICKLLLNRGASPTSLTKNKKSPLKFAVSKGHIELADWLIGELKDQDLDHADNDGWTAFHSASDGNHLEICKLLLNRGASPTSLSKIENFPLILAVNKGHAELAKWLIGEMKDKDLDHANEDGCTAFHYASDGNHLEICKLLLNRGASPTSLTKNKNSPLKFAVSKGHTELTEWLIGELKDEDLDHADKDGWTAFHFASDGNHLEICKRLLVRGANPNILTDFKESPLLLSARKGYTELATWLINELKAEALNQQKEDGCAAFHYASMHDRLDLCKLLLESGANPNIPSKSEGTPLILAIFHKHYELAKWIIGELKDENLNLVNSLGWTAFHCASMHDRLDLCKLLLESGASPNIHSNGFGTPLTLAIRLGRVELAKWLIGELKDEDLNYTDKDGQTAFDMASKCNESEVCKLLLARGFAPKGTINSEKND